VTFVVLGLAAAYLGFFALAGLAAILAKIFAIIFGVLLIVSAFSGARRNRPFA
jgi:uncharacterized membrane protein YtjA (UPF0391 family)